MSLHYSTIGIRECLKWFKFYTERGLDLASDGAWSIFFNLDSNGLELRSNKGYVLDLLCLKFKPKRA